jgi:putative hemolysin
MPLPLVISLLGLLLVTLCSFFSLTEYSIVSSRRSKLKELAARGVRGASRALDLSERPDHVLAIARLGIVTVGILTGLFAGDAIAEFATRTTGGLFDLAPVRMMLGKTIIVVAIILGMYILGDVLPRQIALSRPEWMACRVARPARVLSLLIDPIERSSVAMIQFLLRSVGMRPILEPSVTEEEIKVLLEEGTRSGVFAEAEQQLVERVFRYCDRRAKAMMTPRNQIVWIEITDSPEEIRRKVIQSPQSRFPVCDQSLDNLIGVVEAKNLLASNALGEPLRIRGLLNLPLFLYEGTRGLRILELFRKSGNPVAIVLDEYGSVVGLLTLNDLLQAIVGEFSDHVASEQFEEGHQAQRERLLDGRLPLDEFRELLALPEIPRENYDTLAGFVVARLGRIPKVGEYFQWNGFRFEVARMDGNRVEKVAVLSDDGTT